jgi:aryl-alcohol dehydrogenase-like predicted oxidoreductase
MSADNIRASVDGSLQRLGVEYIDLYCAHQPDTSTPIEESLAAFDELVQAGKIRHVAASNYSAGELEVALASAKGRRLTPFSALQTQYNLVHRQDYEGDLMALCQERDIGCIAYSALADGFLTGKYRRDQALPHSERVEDAAVYCTSEGFATLDTLDVMAAEHGATVPSIALAWLLAQPTVCSALASARTVEQLHAMVSAVRIDLGLPDLARLQRA